MKHIASTQDEHWLVRWNQLCDTGEALMASNRGKGQKKDDYLEKQAALANVLLKKLLEFSNTLFRFFYHGYFGENAKLKNADLIDVEFQAHLDQMQIDPGFFNQETHPAVYVFNQLLKRVSTDMLRIQRAYQLRLTRTPEEFSMDTTLFTADLLGQEILQKINTVLPFGEQFAKTKILTYPDNDVEVRIVPYADILFIGFSVSAFAIFEAENSEISSDYLALAHEAGHLLYRFGMLPQHAQDQSKSVTANVVQNYLQSELRTRITEAGHNIEQVEWISDWLEEIFSDVIGCMLEGPVYLIGFQQIMEVEPPVEIDAPHPKHPIAALRPYVQNQIMNAMPGAPSWVPASGDRLTADWLETMIKTWPNCILRMWPDPKSSHAIEEALFTLENKTHTGREILAITEIAVKMLIDEVITKWGSDLSSVEWMADRLDKVAQQDVDQISQALHTHYCKRIEQRYLAKLDEVAGRGTKREKVELSIADSSMMDTVADVPYAADLVELILNGFWSDEGPKGGGNPGGFG